MTSRLAPLVFLVAGACGSDPPKTDSPTSGAPPPSDKTEVKMEAVPITSASAPDPTPTTSASSTVSAPTGDPSDDPNIGGPQQDAAVEKAVAPVRPRIRACYKKALAAQAGMTGTVTFDTTIAKDGKVSSARFVKKDGNLSDDLINCLTVTTKTMQFTPDRKSQIVAFSFGH